MFHYRIIILRQSAYELGMHAFMQECDNILRVSKDNLSDYIAERQQDLCQSLTDLCCEYGQEHLDLVRETAERLHAMAIFHKVLNGSVIPPVYDDRDR